MLLSCRHVAVCSTRCVCSVHEERGPRPCTTSSIFHKTFPVFAFISVHIPFHALCIIFYSYFICILPVTVCECHIEIKSYLLYLGYLLMPPSTRWLSMHYAAPAWPGMCLAANHARFRTMISRRRPLPICSAPRISYFAASHRSLS